MGGWHGDRATQWFVGLATLPHPGRLLGSRLLARSIRPHVASAMYRPPETAPPSGRPASAQADWSGRARAPGSRTGLA